MEGERRNCCFRVFLLFFCLSFSLWPFSEKGGKVGLSPSLSFPSHSLCFALSVLICSTFEHLYSLFSFWFNVLALHPSITLTLPLMPHHHFIFTTLFFPYLFPSVCFLPSFDYFSNHTITAFSLHLSFCLSRCRAIVV